MKSNFTILSSLYELYKSNLNNTDTLDKVGSIAWALEFDLGFEGHGYFELAELVSTPQSEENSIQHYTQVIEASIKTLKVGN